MKTAPEKKIVKKDVVSKKVLKKTSRIKYDKNKLNIILDIDETLVHTVNLQKPTFVASEKYNKMFVTKTGDCVYIRKHAEEFLEYCFWNFNVSFWSVGTYKYVQEILKTLLGSNYSKSVAIIGRKDTLGNGQGYYDVKNNINFRVAKIGNDATKPLNFLYRHSRYGRIFKKSNTVLIDDNTGNIAVNGDNAIYIPPYCIQQHDNYLLSLLKWTMKVSKMDAFPSKKPKLYNFTDKDRCKSKFKAKSPVDLVIGDRVFHKRLKVHGVILSRKTKKTKTGKNISYEVALGDGFPIKVPSFGLLHEPI